MNLTPEAQTALLSAHPRQGATLSRDVPVEVLGELVSAGLVEVSGLTRRGTIERQRVMSARMDAAFS